MDNALDLSGLSVHDLQTERTVADVVRFMVYERDRNGKNYTIQQACESAGISYSTWKNWVRDGLVVGPLQKTAQELYQAIYAKILPSYGTMIESLVSIACGQAPEGSPTMEIRPSDMIAAFDKLSKIIPIRPLDQITPTRSELEHLQEYQPKQMMIIQGDFVYQGQANGKLGDLPPIDPQDIIEL